MASQPAASAIAAAELRNWPMKPCIRVLSHRRWAVPRPIALGTAEARRRMTAVASCSRWRQVGWHALVWSRSRHPVRGDAQDHPRRHGRVLRRDRAARRPVAARPADRGGLGRERGVVLTASYEARPFGVRSAMPSSRARRLCPELRFVRPRFDAYKQASRQIRAIFARHTDLIEPLSLDEAYLDVTEACRGRTSARSLARAIKAAIHGRARAHRLGRGLVQQVPGQDRLRPREARRADGDPAARRRWPSSPPCRSSGSTASGRPRRGGCGRWASPAAPTCRPAASTSWSQAFGRVGRHYWRHGAGQGRPSGRAGSGAPLVERRDDLRARSARAARRSRRRLAPLADELAERLARSDFFGRTLTLKLRYGDFRWRRAAPRRPCRSATGRQILPTARRAARASGRGPTTRSGSWAWASRTPPTTIAASCCCRSRKCAALGAELDGVRLLLAGLDREAELAVAQHHRMGQRQPAGRGGDVAVDAQEAQCDRLGRVEPGCRRPVRRAARRRPRRVTTIRLSAKPALAIEPVLTGVWTTTRRVSISLAQARSGAAWRSTNSSRSAGTPARSCAEATLISRCSSGAGRPTALQLLELGGAGDGGLRLLLGRRHALAHQRALNSCRLAKIRLEAQNLGPALRQADPIAREHADHERRRQRRNA